MKKTPIPIDFSHFPSQFHPFLQNTAIFDSSCSPTAQVYFLERHQCFLKSAPKGSLQKEAKMSGFFHEKGLGPEVLAYESLEKDWLLTAAIQGEDCLDAQYMADPKRLCDTTAHLLRMLHETAPTGCPVENRTAEYLATARSNYATQNFDCALFPDNWGYASPEEAWQVLEQGSPYFKADTLLHGDYCLPNILLNQWNLAGFIDLGAGGIGDRHVDLFWGQWSLFFNLKTDRYSARFLDAYGRDVIQEELFRVVAAAEVFL